MAYVGQLTKSSDALTGQVGARTFGRFAVVVLHAVVTTEVSYLGLDSCNQCCQAHHSRSSILI